MVDTVSLKKNCIFAGLFRGLTQMDDWKLLETAMSYLPEVIQKCRSNTFHLKNDVKLDLYQFCEYHNHQCNSYHYSCNDVLTT